MLDTSTDADTTTTCPTGSTLDPEEHNTCYAPGSLTNHNTQEFTADECLYFANGAVAELASDEQVNSILTLITCTGTTNCIP